MLKDCVRIAASRSNDYITKCLRDYPDVTKGDHFVGDKALHRTDKVKQLENDVG